MHDQWPFLGAEHYSLRNKVYDYNLCNERFVKGYNSKNRPEGEGGIDINRITWLRKQKSWDRKIYIVCPSNWMSECAKNSKLFKNNPIFTIPNPIDCKKWRPIGKEEARNQLKLPIDKKIILFGALDIKEFRKGAHLLFGALKKLNLLLEQNMIKKLEIVIFGDLNKKEFPDLNLPTRFSGSINNDEILNYFYSSADVFVNPSTLESFGQTASEASSCSTPVVAFKTSGLIDVVDHLSTGFLAKPFNVESLADGIKWVIEDEERNILLGKNARKKAVKEWDYKVVSKKYLEVYNKAVL